MVFDESLKVQVQFHYVLKCNTSEKRFMRLSPQSLCYSLSVVGLGGTGGGFYYNVTSFFMASREVLLPERVSCCFLFKDERGVRQKLYARKKVCDEIKLYLSGLSLWNENLPWEKGLWMKFHELFPPFFRGRR